MRELIRIRQAAPAFHARRVWSAEGRPGSPTVAWHGVQPFRPDWTDDSRSLACTVGDLSASGCLYLSLNAYWEPLTFELPAAENGTRRWRRCIDTALASPHDIEQWARAPEVDGSRYSVQARSVVVLAMARR